MRGAARSAVYTQDAWNRAMGLLARRRTGRGLCTNEGWIFGHVLDGAGGAKPLAPWDAAAVLRAREGGGAWVHLDLRAPRA